DYVVDRLTTAKQSSQPVQLAAEFLSPIARHLSPVARCSSPVAHRPLLIARRPSPIAHRPSPDTISRFCSLDRIKTFCHVIRHQVPPCADSLTVFLHQWSDHWPPSSPASAAAPVGQSQARKSSSSWPRARRATTPAT